MTTSDPTEFLVHRRRLANELRRLRTDAGVSAYRLAEQLRMSQSKASKIENGRVGVSVADVRRWARATGASSAKLAELEQVAELARNETVTVREVMQRGGLAKKQRQFAAMEASAHLLRYFSPVGVPGLLQIPDFARYVFARGKRSEAEISASIAARLDRQKILLDPTRRFQFVLAEAAIRWRFADTEAHLAQLERIRTLSALPNVSVGIIPWTTLAPVWHGHAFVIFSDRGVEEDTLVSYEPYRGETVVSSANEPDRVNDFIEAFKALSRIAVYDSDVHSLLDSVRAALQQLDS